MRLTAGLVDVLMSSKCLECVCCSLVQIWPHEWETLGKYLTLDKEIRVMRVEEDSGHVSYFSLPGTQRAPWFAKCDTVKQQSPTSGPVQRLRVYKCCRDAVDVV